MRWSFYRMKLRGRVFCLLLFILFWLIAVVCESAEAAALDRPEKWPCVMSVTAM